MLLAVSILAVTFSTGCKKDDDPDPIIEGLTLKNFPVIDGSTSTDPLIKLMASSLLGYKCEWQQEGVGDITWRMTTNLPKNFVEQHLKSSKTHQSLLNVIDGTADMTFSARTLSPEEKAYAQEAGVTLIETPVALDALIFITHPDNPVQTITHPQLVDIYSGRIKNWNEVSGNDRMITPLVRNQNSGSQELMESLVMEGPIPEEFMEDLEEYQRVISMYPVFTYVGGNPDALGYTVYYYKENMIRNQSPAKTIAVNGVHPDKQTIGNRTYPFTAEVYLTIRTDLDRSSMAYKVYEFMQTEAGKRIIAESGYVVY